MSRCAVGIGSNIGDRRAHLSAALAGLRSVSAIVAVSSLYETDPVGGPAQDPYLNAVAVVETSRTPADFLRELLTIERARHRIRRERWGPRTLDLDLLIYGRRAVSVDGLTVPHPRMRDRRFVMDPLLEVWPDVETPDGSPIEPADEAVSAQAITRLDGPDWAAEHTGK